MRAATSRYWLQKCRSGEGTPERRREIRGATPRQANQARQDSARRRRQERLDRGFDRTDLGTPHRRALAPFYLFLHIEM